MNTRRTKLFSIHLLPIFIVSIIVLICNFKTGTSATKVSAFLLAPSHNNHDHKIIGTKVIAPISYITTATTHNTLHVLQQAKGDNSKKGGYQFGDITKSLINKITEKDKYEFGDLSKHIDSKVKDRLAKLSNKNEYEFGDLTKYLVQDFTNSTTKYQFGDITKEIIHRVTSKNYTMDDMAILMKALVSFGVGLTPVASILPVKLLIDLLNYSIAGDIGNKVVSSITLELDKRMKKAITGDEQYQVGDVTKKALLDYTGRDSYSFGDITKKVMGSMEEYEQQQKKIAERNLEIKERKKLGIDTYVKTDEDTNADVVIDTKATMIETIDKPTFLSDEQNYDLIAKELEAWDKKYRNELNKNDSSNK
jgi:hypothetical protein